MGRILAYADPPYPGQARRHYAKEALCAEVNHRILIETLTHHYDAWALSTSSPALAAVLPLCPPGTRVMAWVKPFCSFKPGVNPAYAWEPVLVYGLGSRARDEDTVRDWVSANITLRKGLAGVKPYAFCAWLFAVMGATRDDTFVDVFPGSGAVSRAWEAWCGRPTQAPLWEKADHG